MEIWEKQTKHNNFHNNLVKIIMNNLFFFVKFTIAVTQVTKNTLIYFFLIFFLSICDAFSPHTLKFWKNFHILYFHTKVLCRYVHKSINLIYILPLTSLIYAHVKSFDLITYYQTDLNKYDAILFLKTET